MDPTGPSPADRSGWRQQQDQPRGSFFGVELGSELLDAIDVGELLVTLGRLGGARSNDDNQGSKQDEESPEDHPQNPKSEAQLVGSASTTWASFAIEPERVWKVTQTSRP